MVLSVPEKLIPLVINNAWLVRVAGIWNRNERRDWLYVKDHAKAIDLVTENGKMGEVYNIGGHNEEKILKL